MKRTFTEASPLIKAMREMKQHKYCTLRLDNRCEGEAHDIAHVHGHRGMSQKVPDIYTMFVCRHCHDIYDRRINSPLTNNELAVDALRALMETVDMNIAAGNIIVKGINDDNFGDKK